MVIYISYVRLSCNNLITYSGVCGAAIGKVVGSVKKLTVIGEVRDTKKLMISYFHFLTDPM